MKIAVCDDDKRTIDHLTSLIKEKESNARVVSFENGKTMLNTQDVFDMYFLDIEMGEISGLDVAKHIRAVEEKRNMEKSIIIFITGYREYMEYAFDVNAFHYLVKPIDEEKFYAVFKRAIKEVRAKTKYEKSFVLVKSNGVNQKILLKDIYYIESSNKKVVFHTKDGNIYTYGKMEDWQKELGNAFYRCHRGYLVNLEKITAYNVDTINLTNGESIILAQKKYSEFIRTYMWYAKDGGIVNA